MSEPISGPSSNIPLPPTTPQTQDVPLLSKQIQSQALTLAEQLQQLQNDPTLATQETFLQSVVQNGTHMNQTVEKAILVR